MGLGLAFGALDEERFSQCRGGRAGMLIMAGFLRDDLGAMAVGRAAFGVVMANGSGYGGPLDPIRLDLRMGVIRLALELDIDQSGKGTETP